MTCKDCIHHKSCFNMAFRCGYKAECLGGAEHCEDFKNKADFVEIPCRCKDCKYYKPHSPSKHHNPKALYCCRCAVTKVKPDDFCSYGEPKQKNDLNKNN